MGNGSWLTTLNGYLSEKEQAFKSSIGELFHRDRFSELSSATRSGSLNGLSAQEQLTLLAAAQKNLTLVSSGQEFMSWLRLNGRGDVADFIKSMPSDKRLMASQLASGLYFAIDKDIKGVNAFGEDLNPSIGKGVVILSSSRNLSAQDEAFVIFHEIMHANARQSSVDVELPLEMDRSRQSATDKTRRLDGKNFNPATQLAELKADAGALFLVESGSESQRGKVAKSRNDGFVSGDLDHSTGLALNAFDMSKVSTESVEKFMFSVAKEAERHWGVALLQAASVDSRTKVCVSKYRARREEAGVGSEIVDCIDKQLLPSPPSIIRPK